MTKRKWFFLTMLFALLIFGCASYSFAFDSKYICVEGEEKLYYDRGGGWYDLVAECKNNSNTTTQYSCDIFNGKIAQKKVVATRTGYCVDGDSKCNIMDSTSEPVFTVCKGGCNTQTGKCVNEEPSCNGSDYYQCSGRTLIRYDSCGKEKSRTDCGSDSYGDWSFYCSGNDLRKTRSVTTRQCSASSGSCGYSQSTTDDQLVSNCPNGCSGTSCNPAPAPTCASHYSATCNSGSIFYQNSCGITEEVKTQCLYGCAKTVNQCLYEGIGAENEVPSSIVLTEEIIKFLQTSGGVGIMQWRGSQISVEPIPPSDLSDPKIRCSPRISGIVMSNGALIAGKYLCVSFSSGDKESEESTPCEKYGVKITGAEPHFHLELFNFTETDLQKRPILQGKNLQAGLHLTQKDRCLYLWANARKRGLKEPYCKQIICEQGGEKNLGAIDPLKTPTLNAKLSEELSKFLKDIKQSTPDLLRGFEISIASIIPSLTSLAEASLLTVEQGAMSNPYTAPAAVTITGLTLLSTQASDYINVHYSTNSNGGSPRTANTEAPGYLAPNISNAQILAANPDVQNYLDTLILSNYIVIWVLSNGGENFGK